MIFGAIRKHPGGIFHELAKHKGVRSRSHLYKYSTEAFCILYAGYIKGKSAISLARRFAGKIKNFTGEEFLGKGIFCNHGWSR